MFMVFADAEKCFDKLWLKDCIADTVDYRVRKREAAKMNENARIKVMTPCGETKEIQKKKIVKQGTIFGPMLCCGSTSKINDGYQRETAVSPEMSVGSLVYVDDIGAAGTKETIEETTERLQDMESKTNFTFDPDKAR